MRTASGRARGLLAFLLLALSAAWVLLRRRSGAPAALAAVPSAPPDALATDAGLTPEPDAPAAPVAVDTPPGEVPDEVLATDAGLTAEPATAEPATARPEASAQAPTATTPEVGSPEFSEAPTAEIPVPAPADAGSSAGPDDLRAIRGIGPSIERILHGLDITTYRQLAVLEGVELQRLRDALQDFRARVEREDWIGQARDLHRQKYGEAV